MLDIVATVLIVLMFAFIALIVAAMIASAIDTWQRRRAAARSHCEACGAPLGRAALDLADRKWGALDGGPHPPGSFVRYRRLRRTFAICVQCGARHGYDQARRVFPLLAPTDP